jgi:hypothetical protein
MTERWSECGSATSVRPWKTLSKSWSRRAPDTCTRQTPHKHLNLLLPLHCTYSLLAHACEWVSVSWVVWEAAAWKHKWGDSRLRESWPPTLVLSGSNVRFSFSAFYHFFFLVLSFMRVFSQHSSVFSRHFLIFFLLIIVRISWKIVAIRIAYKLQVSPSPTCNIVFSARLRWRKIRTF